MKKVIFLLSFILNHTAASAGSLENALDSLGEDFYQCARYQVETTDYEDQAIFWKDTAVVLCDDLIKKTNDYKTQGLKDSHKIKTDHTTTLKVNGGKGEMTVGEMLKKSTEFREGYFKKQVVLENKAKGEFEATVKTCVANHKELKAKKIKGKKALDAKGTTCQVCYQTYGKLGASLADDFMVNCSDKSMTFVACHDVCEAAYFEFQDAISAL